MDAGGGAVNRYLAWSNELDAVLAAWKLGAASTWTIDTVYTADSAYNEQVGYYCSLDHYNGYVHIAYGMYTDVSTPNYKLVVAFDISGDWVFDTYGTSDAAITETCISHNADWPYVLWSTNNAVNWSHYDGISGFTTTEITSSGGSYGAALGLYIDMSTDEQYAYGNEGEDACFFAQYDPGSNEWDSINEPIPDGRRVAHVGRGGTAMNFVGEELVMSVYDPDMRDSALIVYDIDGIHWEDIADGFATPGYDLSNRAIVCDSNAVPHVVFGDIDPVTNERTLWVARCAGGGAVNAPPPEYKAWEFCLIDSAPSGTLGHATMAIDSNDDYHIAYLKGNDVMYVRGSFDNFGAPQAVYTPGSIDTAPRIALGVNSPLDVNIMFPVPGSWWELTLLTSNDGMATYMEEIALASGDPFTPGSAITQYDLAVRHDGKVVAAAYLGNPDNALFVFDSFAGQQQSFSGTSGLNAGVTLTLDEDMRYSVTATRLSDSTGHLLHWDDQAADYVLDQFTVDADGSTTMSQWRNEYGPFISYTNEDYIGSAPITEGWLYWDYGRGFLDYHVWSFNGMDMPLLHSVDPFYYYAGIFAYYADTAECRYLSIMLGPAP
jgi:hypothetical protein